MEIIRKTRAVGLSAGRQVWPLTIKTLRLHKDHKGGGTNREGIEVLSPNSGADKAEGIVIIEFNCPGAT